MAESRTFKDNILCYNIVQQSFVKIQDSEAAVWNSLQKDGGDKDSVHIHKDMEHFKQ